MNDSGIQSRLAWLDAVLPLTRADAEVPGLDLHGTASAGDHSLPNAFVWLAVCVGTTVDFPNNDGVFHNLPSATVFRLR
jgi:hypothetical protein